MTPTTFAEHIRLHPVVLLWVPPFFWASNIVLGRAVAHAYPPAAFTEGRLIVALLVLTPFVATRAARQRAEILAQGWLIAACGLFGIAGYSVLGYAALQTTPAANVGFVNSTLPLLLPILAFAVEGTPIRPRTLIGILVSFIGVVVLFTHGDPGALRHFNIRVGELLTLIGVANYALYSVLVRRRSPALDPLVFLWGTLAVGIALLVPLVARERASGLWMPLNISALGAVLYTGVFVSLIAFAVWNHCVTTLGANVTGLSYHLVAVFAALFAFVVLGEPLHPYHAAGMALILAGLLLGAVQPGASSTTAHGSA